MTSTTDAGAGTSARRRAGVVDLLRSNRDFRLLYIAQVISLGGDWFATVALLGIVGDLTNNSALAKGAVFVAQSLPAFVMTPWAGPVADRIDRKRIMVVVSTMQAVAALAFLSVGPGRVWMAFVAMSGVTALGAFYGPASQASVANLVDVADLPRATAALSSTWGVMLALGASIGAAFSTIFGRNPAFIADAISFVVAGALISRIRRPTRASAGGQVRPRLRPFHDTREGLRLARSSPTLFALLFSKAGMGLATGVVGLLTVLATGRFHGGDGSIGLLLAARGLGVVIGPMLLTRLGQATVPRILQICALSCIVYGVAYAGVAWAPSIIIAAVLVTVAHLGGGTQWALSTLGLTLQTPDEFRGRIMAADFALVMLTMSLSFVGGGLLERAAGATVALTVLAAIAFTWGLVYLRITAKLRASELAAR